MSASSSVQCVASVSAKAWYLVFTKPRQEHIAVTNLTRQGYETFLPRIAPKNERPSDKDKPLFPRYLFIHLDDQHDNWGPIRSTLGVSHMVRFGEQFARVPDPLIETLRSHLSAYAEAAERHSAIDVGDKVRIVQGIARDYEGIVLAKSAQQRTELLLHTAAGYTAKIVVPDKYLERVA